MPPIRTRTRTVREQRQAPLVTRQASVIPQSWNEESREFDVVLSAGAVARQWRFTDWGIEEFDEELLVSDSAIRMDWLQAGRCPFLDGHHRWSNEAVLGTIVAGTAEVVDGELRARVRLGHREKAEAAMRDIPLGIGNISIGYRVHEYEDITPDGATMRLLRAVDWEVREASLVPIGADVGAGVRSDGEPPTLYPVTITRKQKRTMPPFRRNSSLGERAAILEGILEDQVTEERTRADIVADLAAAAEIEADQVEAILAGDDELDAARAEAFAEVLDVDPLELTPEEAPTPRRRSAGRTPRRRTAARPPSSDDDGEERGRSAGGAGADGAEARAEGVRIASFAYQAAEGLGLSRADADQVLERHAADEGAIMRALVNLRAAADAADPSSLGAGGGVRVTRDEMDNVRDGALNALEHRIDPGRVELRQDGRSFRGLTMRELCRELLRRRGERVEGLSVREIVTRSLHGTSDFAELAGTAANRTLRRAYDGTPRSFLPIARRSDMMDFRPQRRVSVSNFPTLEKVNEHGEVKSGTFGDAAEVKQLETWARGFGVTRRMLIDDDLDALSRIPRMVGAAAARLENFQTWLLFTANVTMGDGNQLFSGAHSNVGSGDSLDKAGLTVMRSAMRTQTDPSGRDRLNLAPRWLIVPAALETDAQEMTSEIVPDASGSVNPFSSQFEGVIVEGQLDADSSTTWYASASVDEIDVVEYGYLDGDEGVSLESFEKSDVLGVWWRAVHDFGVSVLDHRGLWRNAA